MVTGRLTIPTADGDLLHSSAVASEPLESRSQAPAAEVAASSYLRRAAAIQPDEGKKATQHLDSDCGKALLVPDSPGGD